MNIPRQAYPDRWVQFPRFETIGTAGRAAKIAQPRRWLSPDMADTLWHPHTGLLTGTLDLKLQNHWIGVYHSAREHVVRGERYATPPGFAQKLIAKDGKELYRSRVLLHEFLWDEQAVSGRRWEVVLERGRTDEPKFEELMAMLGDPAEPQDGQMLVMKSDDGTWFEPNGLEAYKREFYLETLGCLALNGAPAEEILKLG